jgi:hypothetical protein
LPVVEAPQQEGGRKRAEERERHVLLRVPDVALRAEERVAFGAGGGGDRPLEQLVRRADRQADGDDDEVEPAAPHRVAADEDLAREDRRHEALREVAEAVVVVARQPERVARPIAERHLRVRVMPADAEDHRVDAQQ